MQKNLESLESSYKEFVNFVIKDLIADITTETSVTLEFMDWSDENLSLSAFVTLLKLKKSVSLWKMHIPRLLSTDTLL